MWSNEIPPGYIPVTVEDKKLLSRSMSNGQQLQRLLSNKQQSPFINTFPPPFHSNWPKKVYHKQHGKAAGSKIMTNNLSSQLNVIPGKLFIKLKLSEHLRQIPYMNTIYGVCSSCMNTQFACWLHIYRSKEWSVDNSQSKPHPAFLLTMWKAGNTQSPDITKVVTHCYSHKVFMIMLVGGRERRQETDLQCWAGM